MYKAKSREWIEIHISEGFHKCSRCLHERTGEPYALFCHLNKAGTPIGKSVCWRCCRDAESTLLISQKWPLAFKRTEYTFGWMLEWTSFVGSLVRKSEKP